MISLDLCYLVLRVEFDKLGILVGGEDEEVLPYFDFPQTHWGVRKFLYGEGLMLTVRQYEKPSAASPG